MLESQYVPGNGISRRSHLQWRKSSWDISEIETTADVIYTLAENFNFNFRIYKILPYLHSFASFSSTESMFAFLSISSSPSLSSSSLSKIYIHLQCAEPEFRFSLTKLWSREKHCTTTSVIKVPLLKVGVYLCM